MIKEVEGDLIKMAKENNFNVIVHGCNLYKSMSHGIARQIAIEFPMAEMVDKNTIARLGSYSYADVGCCAIINAYTQTSPGKMSVGWWNVVGYENMRKIFKIINKNFMGLKIGLPLIGCGIAGGDWNIVKQIIVDELKDCDITIVHYKP